jgi:hypothetical protein
VKTNTTQKATEALLVTSKQVGLEAWFLTFTTVDNSLVLKILPSTYIKNHSSGSGFKPNIQHNNKTKDSKLNTSILQ